MSLSLQLRLGVAPRADVDEVAFERGSCCHRWRDQMRAALVALTAFEVAVRGRSTALAGLQLIGVHAEAHGAAGLTPFESGVQEDLVETLGLGLLFDETRAGNDHGVG